MTKDLGLFVIDDQLYQMEWCPYRFARKHVENDYPWTEPSGAPTPMEIGLYGEGLTLGSSAKGQHMTELRRQKNGTKYVAHKRVDVMAQRLYGYLYGLGARWGTYNTQIPLIAKYRDKVWVRGEYDIFPTQFNGDLAIIDTKFTKDVQNIYSSISEKNIRHATIACWGDYDNVQKNQPLIYHYIARNFKAVGVENMCKYKPDKAHIYQELFSQKHDYDKTVFYFVVAGYGVKDLDHQLDHFKYEWNRKREVLFEYLIDAAVRRIDDGIKDNFKPNKKKQLCNKCELREVCFG